MPVKTDTFKPFRDDHLKNRVAWIRKSVKMISAANFEYLTHYARAIAELVTEFEALQIKSEDGPAKSLDPMRASTLLRSPHYRPIIDAGFAMGASPAVSSFSDDEALKIKIAGLTAQIALLKNKIIRMDQGDYSSDSNDESLSKALQAKKLDVLHLLKLIDKLTDQFKDALRLVLPGEESDGRPVAGLYGPYGMIETLEYMNQVDRIRHEKN